MKNVIYLIFTINLMFCYSQNSSSDLKRNTMKKFDLKEFENLPLDSHYVSSEYRKHYLTDKEAIDVCIRTDDILVIRLDRHTNYATGELYYKKTGTLKMEGRYFFNEAIGIWRYYDENGNFIKELKQDEGFVSIELLIEKLKKEYDLDIVSKKLFDVNHYRMDNKPYYQISYYVCEEIGKVEMLLFDGETGKLLFRESGYVGCGLEPGDSLYNLYMKSLKK